MKIKIEGGALSLDIGEFCDSLDDDSKRVVAQQLGANEYLWKQVLETLANPHNGFEVGDDWWSFDRRTMLEIREKLIPLMPEVSRLAVQEALRQRDEAKSDGERHQRWAWAMYHAHQDHGFDRCTPWPELPVWAPVDQTAMKVRDAAPNLQEALKRVLAAWKAEANAGDGIAEEHVETYQFACAVLAALSEVES